MKTIGQLRELIKDLPDHMPVDFAPITRAWLGSSDPIYARKVEIYTHDGWGRADVSDPTAKCTLYLYEESDETFE
jgi:hypothetical protein